MSRRSGRLEATKDGPKVVVQQVLQVDPPEPEPPADQEPPQEGPEAAKKPELKTRLRPNRSSWRQRFSPPPLSKNKIKRESDNVIYIKSETMEEQEDQHGENNEAREEEESDEVQNLQEDQVGQHQEGQEQEQEKEEEEEEEEGEEEEEEEEEATEEPAEEEVVEQTEVAPMEVVHLEEQHVLIVPDSLEQVEEEVEEPMEAEEADDGNEQTQIMDSIPEEASEAERICAVVQQDQLIQQFGLNLANMSPNPNSRETILAVSQRMIELVRLLIAAQSINSSIDSLAALFRTDYWPTILSAIKYVSGYEDGLAKNPQYIFDIGQALRFCAFILKREAQENGNDDYEGQAQQFLDTIEVNMSTITTDQAVTVVAEQAIETETVTTEIVTDEPSQEYRVILSNPTGEESQPVTLSLQVANEDLTMPGTVQVVKIISTPTGKKGIIIPTRILSKKV
ncbi:Hypothetical predicted protein [Cloeon dipterum]|uniref:Uncharacterized protein n=1 Tax=Cloeon dipterum TaxID=197152 RepID=A0A8S1DBK8_9INSE|nr:Hypothetical predicted protein [Cloeon dipterum]